MARSHARSDAASIGFPHPRGDGPMSGIDNRINRLISPPAWGWPGGGSLKTAPAIDFPTRVGMARYGRRRQHPLHGFPHPRGDGPSIVEFDFVLVLISPPAWGWPVSEHNPLVRKTDFPTRVGMAPRVAAPLDVFLGFPHPRGDGPLTPLYPSHFL